MVESETFYRVWVGCAPHEHWPGQVYEGYSCWAYIGWESDTIWDPNRRGE